MVDEFKERTRMSILNVAYSGLSAFQRALDVTGNNIVNALNRGYSRQSVQFSPGPSVRFAGSYVGSGVTIDSVYRNVDQFANAQLRNTTSVKSQYDTFYQQAAQIDKLLSQNGSNISSSLQSFFDALGQLNSTPDSLVSRNSLLIQSKALADQFTSLQARLDEYQKNSTQQISESVSQINQLTAAIASINQQIMGQGHPPDLLDERDMLIQKLSQYMDLTVSEQSDGTVNVGLSSGEPIVTGTSQNILNVASGQTNYLGTQLFLSCGSGQIEVTSKLSSGSIGGLLDYEQSVIGQASQSIGQLAIGLAQKMNAQHQLGMDMNDQIGKPFFNDFNTAALQLSRSFGSPGNTGSGVLSVRISDISQTKLSDYQLIVSDASTHQLRLVRQSDGTSTTLNWSSNPPSPPAAQVIVDGMTVTVDDVTHLVNNDQFTLTPTRGAARELEFQLTSAVELAMASPVKTQAAVNNTGTGQISLGSVLNTNAVNRQYRIDFVSPTQYNIVDVTNSTTSGPFAFTPNSTNTVQIPDSINPSYSLVLSGIPNTGDQFTADYNAGGYGDNRNGLILASIQQNKFFSGGTEGLFDRYANLVGQIGSETNQAKIRADSADVLYKQALDYQQSKSGVNIDEEGANLLRLQQAYQAAGKLLEVANQVMNTLIDMTR